MGLIKPWNTVYPANVDSKLTSLPTLTDDVDDVLASHQNASADAIIYLERENTGYKDNIVITATTGVYIDQRGMENVVGSAMFDGAALYHLIPHLRLLGMYNLNGGAAQGNLRLRLYDMGPPGTPLLPPVLRSTVSIPYTSNGVLAKGQTVLTTSASPGVGGNEVHNTLRVYEFRVILDGAPSGATAMVNWAGLALGVTQ